MKQETRVYPQSCLSMYCGDMVCRPNCQFLPALKKFKVWRDKHNAKTNHPDSLIYHSTKGQS